MRIHRAERDPWLPDSPPLAECPLGRPAGAEHALLGEQRRHVPEGHVGRDQHDAQLLRREHHRDVHIAREVCEPFGVTRIGKARQMQRVLVGRCGDDRVDLALQSQLHRGLDGVPRDPSRPHGARAIAVPLAASLAPGAYREPMPGGNLGDLILRTDDRHLRLEPAPSNARAAISGPMPRGSPRVIAMRGRSVIGGASF